MEQKAGTRKLLLEVNEEILDWINDYKYAVLVHQGRILNNNNVLEEAILSLKREVTSLKKMPIDPRPVGVRHMETSIRKAQMEGRARKAKQDKNKE